MVYRSSFLRSICLLLSVALCFGAIGAVQAAPQGYASSQKPVVKTTAQFSHSHIDITPAVPAWKGDFTSPNRDLAGNLKKDLPSVAKSTSRVNVSIPDRTHILNPPKDRVPRNASAKSPLISGTGNVVYVDIEGGFYGIIADDGTHYLPENLPASCRVDGIRVKFSGMVKAPAPNIRMWGTTLRILSATPLGDEIKVNGTVEFIELEGGFYGIVTNSGEHYLPMNLPEDFRIDGLEVTFTAMAAPDIYTIYMWGTPVTIVSMSKRSNVGESESTALSGSWTLTSIAQGSSAKPVIPGTEITAEFSDDGKVSGISGCNLYSASCEATGYSLEMGLARSTEMYCSDSPEGIMDQESTYLQLLGKSASWKVRDGNLVISDASGHEILVFAPGIADTSDGEEPLVEFWRTGGFSGMNDHLVISPDGSVSLTRKGYTVGFTLSGEERETIEALLEDSGFMGLARHYHAPPESADLFIYQISCNGKTVLVEDTAIPKALQPLIEELSRLVVENAPDDVMHPPGF